MNIINVVKNVKAVTKDVGKENTFHHKNDFFKSKLYFILN